MFDVQSDEQLNSNEEFTAADTFLPAVHITSQVYRMMTVNMDKNNLCSIKNRKWPF